MLFLCKSVDLDSSDKNQLLKELEELCRQTSGPLRVVKERQTWPFADGGPKKLYLRERTIFEAVQEEVGDFLGFETKADAVKHSIEELEAIFPTIKNHIHNAAKSAELDFEIPATRFVASEDGHCGVFLNSSRKALPFTLIERVRGTTSKKLATGIAEVLLPEDDVFSEKESSSEDVKNDGAIQTKVHKSTVHSTTSLHGREVLDQQDVSDNSQIDSPNCAIDGNISEDEKQNEPETTTKPIKVLHQRIRETGKSVLWNDSLLRAHSSAGEKNSAQVFNKNGGSQRNESAKNELSNDQDDSLVDWSSPSAKHYEGKDLGSNSGFKSDFSDDMSEDFSSNFWRDCDSPCLGVFKFEMEKSSGDKLESDSNFCQYLSNQDTEDPTSEVLGDQDCQSVVDSYASVERNTGIKSKSGEECNVTHDIKKNMAGAEIRNKQSTAMPIKQSEHPFPQAMVMECSPPLRSLSNALADRTSVKFISRVHLMHMHGLYKCPPGLSVVPLSPLSIHCNSLFISSELSKYSGYGNGSAFQAIYKAYRDAMVTKLLDYEGATGPNGAMHLSSIDGLPHIDDLWVCVNVEDEDNIERAEPDMNYWRSFYMQFLVSAMEVNPDGSTVLEPLPSYWIRNNSQSTPVWTDENVAGLAGAALLMRDSNVMRGKGFQSITLAITDAELRDRVEKELIKQEEEYMMS